jgi:glycosyltransferase involved in cell wall biosynthesis
MLTILIEGWLRYPHSYSIVNVYQILALLRKNENIKLLLSEQPPYREEWKEITDLTGILVTKEEQEILNNVPRWDGMEACDLVFRISYPFDISSTRVKIFSEDLLHSPIVLFYTSEFSLLKDAHFVSGTCKGFIEKCYTKELLPITPSNWSAGALLREKFNPLVIPHGVDELKYFPDSEGGRSLRDRYDIPKEAFVFLNVSAMTGNKNVKGMIKAFYRLTFLVDDIFLVFKGINDLYECEKNINATVKELFSSGCFTIKHWKKVRDRLIFIGDLFTFTEMRHLYNAADCYLSPYHAEGFNMPVLEAMACSCPLILSKGGSTDDFTNEKFTMYPKTLPLVTSEGERCLLVDDTSLQETMMTMMSDTNFRSRAKGAARQHALAHYTWDKVTDKLYNFFKFVVPMVMPSKPDSLHQSSLCIP